MSTGSIAFSWATRRTWTQRGMGGALTGGAGVAEKEYVLGNKAKDLYQFTRQATKPGPDDKVDAKDAAKVMRTIAKARTIEEMRDMLNAAADRLDNRRKRPFFPKSETFGMIKDLRSGARAIIKGVYAANETRFNERPEERLREIKAVIDECNLMLQLVELAHDLGYTDMKRMGVWTKRILDVKHMCLAWMKKDSERAKTILAKRERDNCEMLVVLVREILAAEGRQQMRV